MKFKFSLASVLRVREHQEKLQKQKLAEEVSKKKDINELREKVQMKLENYLQDARTAEAENIHLIRRRSRHMQQVHQHMNKLTGELEKAEVVVVKEREKLATAHKNRHILEKVREFEHQLFAKKLSQDEQKFMDEIATQTSGR
ncbi:MAG TPA: flagellar FliJ family protein [Halalkalibaculum sp.]|nr:flagellar FliJ family protein [Halalkalibaculum sp.]